MLSYNGTQFAAAKLSVLVTTVHGNSSLRRALIASSLGITLQRLCAHPQQRAVKQLLLCRPAAGQAGASRASQAVGWAQRETCQDIPS